MLLSRTPSGLTTLQGKRLSSRQKKLQRTTPHRNFLQQLPKKPQTPPKNDPGNLHAAIISVCAEETSKASNEIRQMKRESQMPHGMHHEKTKSAKRISQKRFSN